MNIWNGSDGEEYGIDQNIFVASTLALIAHRNIIIRSVNSDRTIFEIIWVLKECWGLDCNTVRCENDFELDEVEGNVILVGIDLIDGIKHQKVRKSIRNRKSGIVIGIIGIDNGDFLKGIDMNMILLLREFWISQNHRTDREETDYSNIKIRSSKLNELKELNLKIDEIVMVSEMHRYIYDIVVHLRTHRCVHRGIATLMISEIHLLVKALSVLFNKEYVIPTIVKLACRKLMPIHIVTVPPEQEPTLIYGSDLLLVKELMKRMTNELIIEDVLKNVSVPL